MSQTQQWFNSFSFRHFIQAFHFNCNTDLNSLPVQSWKLQLLSSSRYWVCLPGGAACWTAVFTSPDVMNWFWSVVVLIKESWCGVVPQACHCMVCSWDHLSVHSIQKALYSPFMHLKMSCHICCSSASINCSILIVQFHYAKAIKCPLMASIPLLYIHCSTSSQSCIQLKSLECGSCGKKEGVWVYSWWVVNVQWLACATILYAYRGYIKLSTHIK